MRRLSCRCGQAVFFDNDSCGDCGRRLAYDPATLRMQAEEAPGAGLDFCANRDGDSRCNWIAPSGAPGGVCLSCRTSQMIPALGKPENRMRWRKLEKAKRRLIVDLLQLGLPVNPDHLRFEFKEDRRTNPDVHDDHIATGHARGVITINAAEADEVFREQMRQQMNEPWRTLLGHFRHESGHYYFNEVLDEAGKQAARELFGDERSDYFAALERYYRDGPPADWTKRYISSYSSAHPAEDWAECWAHYLHVRAVLGVAEEYGIRTHSNDESWRGQFVALAISLNEIMRNLGLPDAYPFVLSGVIARKIEFVHDAVTTYAARQA